MVLVIMILSIILVLVLIFAEKYDLKHAPKPKLQNQG
jgi:hypothetical protein